MSGLTRRVVSVAVVASFAIGGAVTVAARRGPTCFGKRATIVGTDKRDRIRGTKGPDVIAALGGPDTVAGRGGNDLVCGGRGDDTLSGGEDDDRMDAGAGSGETLAGNGGNDYLDGGPGVFEDVRFVTSRRGVTVSLEAGTATGEGSDTLASIDQVVASQHDDTVYGNDDPATADFLLALGGDDVVYGLGGNDVIGGGDGDDTLDGGDGFDMINNVYGYAEFGQSQGGVNVNLPGKTVTGHGTDAIEGFEGSTGTNADDVLLGDDGPNELTQTFLGNDTASGGEGDDLIDLGDGSDSAFGGGGIDTIGHLDHSVAVTVDLGAGTGTGNGTDQIEGFESILGSAFDDTLTGDDGVNVIEGDFGDDTLYGLGGDDTLIGFNWAFPHDPVEDSAHGGDGSDVCSARTQTECEWEPPVVRRPATYAMGYTRPPKW